MSILSRVNEIRLAQMMRKATHIRQFDNAVRDPAAAQAHKLMQIVRANAGTKFGKKHHFDRIKTVADFQSLVPACSYQDLFPYIEAAMQGQPAQLTAESPLMFATTSGTTAQPKFIPITPSHLRDYTHAFQIHNYHLIQDFPQAAATGRFLIISSNDEEGLCPSGVPYGAVSGFLNRRQSPIVRKYFALPHQVNKIKDVDAKYYVLLRVALVQNITAILSCNPSSLLLLAEELKQHAEGLIRDIYDGGINSQYAPEAELLGAVEHLISADPEKARQLESLLTQGGLKPKSVWPNLDVLSCWKGGPMSFYLDRLPDKFGSVSVRDFGYMASEGRGSIPITDHGAAGVLAVSSHFYEFVAEEEMESESRHFLTADKLQVGRRYFIFFTTASGLYRYNINDLIEVSSMHVNTPVIQFIRKGAGVSSITGEKLTEEQVQLALSYASSTLDLTQTLKHCMLTIRFNHDHMPYYTCLAELDGEMPDGLRDKFCQIVEEALQSQNIEYKDKRDGKRLGGVEFESVPAGTFARLRQQRIAQGAAEAQVKIPLLGSLDRDLSFPGRRPGWKSAGLQSPSK